MPEKNKKLEDFINSHRGEFDTQSPPEGLWNNIDAQLGKQKKPFNWSLYIKRAAAVVIIAVSSIAAYEYWIDEEVPEIAIQTIETPVQQDNLLPDEVEEAEQYYTSQINDRYNELNKYAALYPEVKQDIQVDMAELDSAYTDLKKDLKEDLANEEIIEAMIENYRLKLEILEEILEQLKSINKKDNSYEDLSA